MRSIKKAISGLGIVALSYLPLNAQEPNPLAIKAGIAYNIVNITRLSKNSLGIETLLEKGLKERLYGEWEIGMYADTRTTNKIVYSKMQTNVGLKYKPIVKNGWSAGGKLALGVSNEFYKNIEEAIPTQRVTLNKLVGLDIEKKFKNGRGVNLAVSKEIDRNIWRIGLRGILKPESISHRNYSNRYPWPQF